MSEAIPTAQTRREMFLSAAVYKDTSLCPTPVTREEKYLYAIAESGSSGGVTGVKGDSEVEYRTGDVNITPANIGAISADLAGVASGVATLNESGKIPEGQLPSYVDDVIEGYYNTTDNKFYEESTYQTEIVGERGKIYVDLTGNKEYRWSGSAFVVVPDSITVDSTPTEGSTNAVSSGSAYDIARRSLVGYYMGYFFSEQTDFLKIRYPYFYFSLLFVMRSVDGVSNTLYTKECAVFLLNHKMTVPIEITNFSDVPVSVSVLNVSSSSQGSYVLIRINPYSGTRLLAMWYPLLNGNIGSTSAIKDYTNFMVNPKE